MDLAADVLAEFYGKEISRFTTDDVIQVVENWKRSVLDMDKFLYEDAKKEFSMSKMTGFGVDGTNGAREEDFTQVRGEFDNNATVLVIKHHMEKKEKLGNEIISQMQMLKSQNPNLNTQISSSQY